MRVQGSGFEVEGSRFRVQGSGRRVQGAGFRVQGARFIGAGFRVQGSGCTDAAVGSLGPLEDGPLFRVAWGPAFAPRSTRPLLVEFRV